MGKVRLSNIELLRIIAIFLIMVVHGCYMTFGTPVPEAIREAPLSFLPRMFVQNVAVVCVDVFVLITGWFGVHTKIKSIGGLYFQIVFFAALWYVVACVTGIANLSVGGVAKVFMLKQSFALCYIVMYAFTPVMNAFVENASKRQFKWFLIIFFAIAFLFGWTFVLSDFNSGATSVLLFMGLYLLGRYIRLYSRVKDWTLQKLVACYLVLLAFETFVPWGISMTGVSDHLANISLNMLTAYISPNVIAKSALLLLIFSKFTFQSRCINTVAASSFAVVLLHGNSWVFPDRYCSVIRWFSDAYTPPPVFLVATLVFMIGIYALAVLIDKPRLFLWNRLFAFVQRKFAVKGINIS